MKIIIRSKTNIGRFRQLLSCALLVVSVFSMGDAFAQARKKPKGAAAAKRAEAKPAVAVAVDPDSSELSDSNSVQQEPRKATRWSTLGLTLGFAGNYAMPKPYIQGAPDSLTLAKENGYNYAAKLSLDYHSGLRLFGGFENFDYKISSSQSGVTQNYHYAGYKALMGIEITPQGIGKAKDVHVGWGFGLVLGGGFYLPTTATVDIGGQTIDRGAFANRLMGFGRIGARVYYSFDFGVNLGLGYFYDHVSGGVEKATDTNEQTKQINSHNFQVFVDARILNFGDTTYDR